MEGGRERERPRREGREDEEKKGRVQGVGERDVRGMEWKESRRQRDDLKFDIQTLESRSQLVSVSNMNNLIFRNLCNHVKIQKSNSKLTSRGRSKHDNTQQEIVLIMLII